MTHALNIVWNPSEGIDLGFFIIRYYSLMFVIAFGLGWYIMKHIFEREGESLEKLDSLFIWTVLATLIGARLGHVFFYDWEYYRNHLLEIILPFRFSPNFEFSARNLRKWVLQIVSKEWICAKRMDFQGVLCLYYLNSDGL